MKNCSKNYNARISITIYSFQDVRRGRKINNIQLGPDNNKLQINFGAKDTSKEKLSNKDDVSDRSNARYNRIFKKTSQVCKYFHTQ